MNGPPRHHDVLVGVESGLVVDRSDPGMLRSELLGVA